MRIPLSAHRETLPEGRVDWGRARTTYTRDRTPVGGNGGTVRNLMVGFVLGPVPRHRARVVDGPVRDLPLEPGTGWVLPPGADFKCAWDGLADRINLEVTAELVAASGVAAGLAPRHGVVDPTLVQLILNLHAAGSPPDDAAAAAYQDSLTWALLAHLGRVGPASAAERRPAGDPRLARVRAHVQDRLADRLDLAALAGVAVMSPFHFAKSFKAETGLAPHRYVVRERIGRAEALLRSTRVPVAEVARRVGYRDASRFARLFRRETGQAPGAFRAAVAS